MTLGILTEHCRVFNRFVISQSERKKKTMKYSDFNDWSNKLAISQSLARVQKCTSILVDVGRLSVGRCFLLITQGSCMYRCIFYKILIARNHLTLDMALPIHGLSYGAAICRSWQLVEKEDGVIL